MIKYVFTGFAFAYMVTLMMAFSYTFGYDLLMYGIPGLWAVLAGLGFYHISNEKKANVPKLMAFIGLMLILLAPFPMGFTLKDITTGRRQSTIVEVFFGVLNGGGFVMYSLAVLAGNLFSQRWRDLIGVSLAFGWFVGMNSVYYRFAIVPDLFKIAVLLSAGFFGTLALTFTKESHAHQSHKHETEESLLANPDQA